MAWLRPALLLGLFAAPGIAVEVPQRPMPEIDGVFGEEEWRDAARLAVEGGEARILVSGRVLCVGVRMARPYAGERIDLHVADENGKNYAWHALHPACTIPPLSPYPIAPVIVRRASFKLRAKAPLAPPESCLFRARVYTDAGAWSAQAAFGLEALEVGPLQRMVFQLNVVDPAGRAPTLAFAPTRGDQLEQWEALEADWPAKAPLFLTPDEDRRRAFEIALFLETLGTLLGRPAEVRPLAGALEERKNNEKIDALVAGLDDCIAADPFDLYALATKVSVLRQANRLARAWKAQERLWRLEPGRGSLLIAGAQRQLLFADSRFEEGLRLDLPGRGDPEMQAVLDAWRDELRARERDAERDDLPRVALETTRGRVVVELFEEDAPNAVAWLLSLAAGGVLEDRAFGPVTGAAYAEVALGVDDPAAAESCARKAWRGAVSFVPVGEALGPLRFATGHLETPAVGRVIEGMEVVDALEFGDRLVSATVLRKRDHAYPVRRPER